jgi:hypothetical protein
MKSNIPCWISRLSNFCSHDRLFHILYNSTFIIHYSMLLSKSLTVVTLTSTYLLTPWLYGPLRTSTSFTKHAHSSLIRHLSLGFLTYSYIVFWAEVVSLKPNPQPGGLMVTFRPTLLFNLLAWIALPEVYPPASIALQLIKACKLSHHVKVDAQGDEMK